MNDVADRLESIRERVETATEGPWEVDWQSGDDFAVYADRTTCVLTGQVHDGDEHEATANAEFIASSRSDVPYLLSLVGEVGGALAMFTESHLDRHVYGPLDQHGESEAADLLAALRDAAQEGAE